MNLSRLGASPGYYSDEGNRASNTYFKNTPKELQRLAGG